MKVNDFLKKVNAGTAKLPIYLQEGISGKPRKVEMTDFLGYHYKEKDRTLMSISIKEDHLTVYYK